MKKISKLLFLLFLPMTLLLQSCNGDTKTYKVTAENGVNVRATPSVKGKVLSKLDQYEIVEVISIEGDWAKIKYNDQEAFVSAKHIEEKTFMDSVITVLVGIIFLVMFIRVIFGGGGKLIRRNKDGSLDKRFKENR